MMVAVKEDETKVLVDAIVTVLLFQGAAVKQQIQMSSDGRVRIICQMSTLTEAVVVERPVDLLRDLLVNDLDEFWETVAGMVEEAFTRAMEHQRRRFIRAM